MYGSGIIRMWCVYVRVCVGGARVCVCREFKFLNLFQGGSDISEGLEIMLKNNKFEVESVSCI